mmetsp:Transcript_113166/g.320297  ORF Transcript_113166/g.320297 Transcript_113166/m.320297 type:complete len:214 (+) Transcript_113166:1036-1677(+)
MARAMVSNAGGHSASQRPGRARSQSWAMSCSDSLSSASATKFLGGAAPGAQADSMAARSRQRVPRKRPQPPVGPSMPAARSCTSTPGCRQPGSTAELRWRTQISSTTRRSTKRNPRCCNKAAIRRSLASSTHSCTSTLMTSTTWRPKSKPCKISSSPPSRSSDKYWMCARRPRCSSKMSFKVRHCLTVLPTGFKTSMPRVPVKPLVSPSSEKS